MTDARTKLIEVFGEKDALALEDATYARFLKGKEKEPVCRYEVIPSTYAEGSPVLIAIGSYCEIASLPLYLAEERCPGLVRLAKGEYSGGSEYVDGVDGVFFSEDEADTYLKAGMEND